MVDVIDLRAWRPLDLYKLKLIWQEIEERLEKGISVSLIGTKEELAYFSLVYAVPFEDQEVVHRPVMVNEAIRYLEIKVGGIYVDATVGAGGHSLKIAEEIGPNGILIGIDRDPEIIEIAKKRLGKFRNVQLIQGDFSELSRILKELGIKEIDGILFDFGLSSYHLERSGRGFSHERNEILDMRFNPGEGEPAWEILKKKSFTELYKIFKTYGEEPLSRRIAKEVKRLIEERGEIKTTYELNEAIYRAVPYRKQAKAKARIYQALRIYVNKELQRIVKGLGEACKVLKEDGNLVAISYHSLEDRIVKGLKFCSNLKPLLKKPLTPSESEIIENPRSRSARLRAYKKEGKIDSEDVINCLNAYAGVFR